jgi:hypothetical protein
MKLGNPRLVAGSAELARAAGAVRTAQAQARDADVRPYIEQARRAGARTLRELAAALTARGIPTPSGTGRAWRAEQVRRALGRIP